MIRRRLRLLVVFCIAAASAIAVGHADPSSPITVTNVDSPDPVASGNQLTYAITIVNTGGSKLTNMVFSDQVNGIGGIGVPPQLQLTSTRGSCVQNGNLVTCNGGSIEGNGSWVITIRGIVTASNGTTINNTASISGTRSAQNFTTTATASTLVSNGGGSGLPDLSISKAGPTSVNTSSPMSYTLTVNNTGTLNAMNVKVVDTVPAGLTGISATGTSLFVCNVAGQTVTCDGGAVNQGANATITINATSPAATGTITNTAVVDPDNTIEESNELNNTSALVDTNVVSGGGGGQLTINKTDNPAEIPGAGPDPVTPGGTLTYKILVTNASNQRADDVVIVDGTQGLEAASIVATQVVTNGTVGTFGGCVVTAPQTRCNVRTLNPGGTILMTVTGQVIASAGSTIFNTATVTGNIKNLGTTATDTELTTVKPLVDLTITKSDSPDPVCASSWPGLVPPTPTVCRGGLTYTFVVGNSGISQATGVLIRDPLPPGTRFDSFVAPAFSGGCSVDPQNVVTCTGGTIPPQSTVPVKIVLVAPPTTGVITNTVTVDPNNAIFESDETNNTATATTTVITGVDLTITKTDAAPGFDPIATSGTETYTITVDDIGTQDVSNIRVRDTLPANTIFRSATADHGFTCSQAGGVVECVGGSLKGTLSEFYPPLGAPGNDVATIIIKIFAQPIVGTMHNEVRVDPLNEIAEANEANNIAVEDTTVVNGGSGQGAFNQLTILKTQVSPANPVARNAKVTYNIHIGNDGTDPAVGVAVRDFLPAGAHYIQATGTNQFHCTESNNIVDCVGGQLPAGGVGANITVVMFAPDTPGSYTNQAIVDPDNAIPEGNETDNQSSVQTTVTNGGNGAFIDLTIHKDATPTVAPGEQIVYTLTVSNIGSDPALNVAVRDVLPAGSTFVSADDTTVAPGAFTCGFAAGVVNCVGATIDGGVLPDDPIPGVPTVRTIKIVVTAPNQIIENYLNKAEVDPDNTIPEGDETNNTSSDVTDIHSRINLSITKNGPTTSSQSQTTSYNIVIKNNAPGGVKADGLNAQGVKMHDPLPVGLIPLAIDTGSGNNWACQVLQDPINVVDCVGDLEAEQEITIKIDVFMTAEGSRALDNEACVDPDNVFPEFSPGETDNCSTHTTETNPTKFPDLLVSKNVDATVATPGTVLTYTVVVANVGTAPARGALLVTDKIPDHTTFVDAIGGNGWTCTFDSGTKVVSCTNPVAPNDGFAIGASAQMTIHTTIDNDATLPISNTAKSENPAPADHAAPECTTPNVCEDENNALNDQASVTTSLSGSSVGIDLAISSITDNPDPATRARALTYTVIAINAGTEATDPSNKPHVRLDIPPNGVTFLSAAGSNGFVCSGPDASHRVDCVGDLPGGGNTVITLSLIVLQGAPNTLNMTATIDPDHLINELQEGNNTQLEVTTVAPGGTCTLSPCIDLVAAQLFAVPDPVSLGGSVSVNFVVVNVGDTPTALDPSTGGGQPLFAFGLFGTHTTSARVTSPGAPDIVCTDSTNNATARVSSCFGNLAPGQGVTFTMTFDGVTGTDLFAIGVADPLSKIVEFVEDNNTASKTIIIQP